MIGLLAFVTTASAQSAPSSDLSITSFGLQGYSATSVGPANGAPAADVDVLLAQRLRWTLADVGAARVRALADARFTVDPRPGLLGEGQTLEVHNVRQLGFEVSSDRVLVDVGRHPVYRGGPRLVDGLQVLVRSGPALQVGAWAGLAPSLFDTDFRMRPGGGPILAWITSRLQASLVGEVTLYGGELDRAAMLGMGRYTVSRQFEVSGRIDLDLATPDGGPGLADAQVATVIAPSRATRFELFYDGFSSYRYISSADLDPELQRFAQRLRDLGQVQQVDNETVDPTINHLFGATFRAVKPGNDPSPHVELRARYREHPLARNRYARLQPTLGVVRLAGRADLLLTGNWLKVEQRAQFDVGVLGAWALTDLATVDMSVRALSVPDDYAGLGVYADLFVDVVAPGPDVLVLAGVSYLSEPDVDVADGEIGLFVRMSKYVRSRRFDRRAQGLGEVGEPPRR